MFFMRLDSLEMCERQIFVVYYESIASICMKHREIIVTDISVTEFEMVLKRFSLYNVKPS